MAPSPGAGHREGMGQEELPLCGTPAAWPMCGDLEVWSLNFVKALRI